MAISAKDVKRLRDLTGVGMMDCKKALAEADGDFDEAVELLRKKGQKVAAKRADREATEGLVITKQGPEGKAAAIVEVNCETDFVARNDDFVAFAEAIADVVMQERPDDLDALHALPFEGDKTIEQAVVQQTGRIGEKIEVRRFAILTSEDGQVIEYTHPGSKLGVLVEMTGNGDLDATGRDVAMQVAAMDPLAAHREDVPEEVQEKELEIGRETARNEGKPDHILDRIATGKLERYFKDNVLVEQPFVKDSKQSVGEMLKAQDAQVVRYVRYALGA